MRRALHLAVAAVAMTLIAHVAAAGAPQRRAGTTHTVTIDGTAFSPADLTVKAGDTVLFVNKDPFPHTATSRGHFDSHAIDEGKSWAYRATRKGDFPYVCSYHPTMRGTLHVVE